MYYYSTQMSSYGETSSSLPLFQVQRVLSYDSVGDTAQDHASNEEVEENGDLVKWRNTKRKRAQNFTFTALDRSKYYIFQVQNNGSADHTADEDLECHTLNF